MGIVLVDGKEIEVADDERLNGIQVAQRAGVEIPHYCWHPGLSVVASCRMCLVETGTRDAESGQINMVPKLVPACQTPAKDGTVFVTNSDKVSHSRAFVEECLLLDHPIDCAICDKAGECSLQDYHFNYGQPQRRADIRPFTSRRRGLGDTVTLFVDRCVMCTRCVRFTREISGTSELMVTQRGNHEEIDVFEGFPLDNKMSGNVVDLCPVGALGDKDFLYEQRVWFMNSHPGVCAGCSTGCSIKVEENQQRIYRLKPRENPQINQWWMCDEGRYGFHHVHDPQRLVEPQILQDDEFVDVEWSRMLSELEGILQRATRWAAVLSPHRTVEEAFLLATLVRRHDPQALLALGPVPTVGQDETFPNGFTIHAEKCPNRRGVEEVIRHFSDGQVMTCDALGSQLAHEPTDGVWITGGYPQSDWIDTSAAEQFDGVPVRIVQDMFSSPIWQRATHRLPGVSFAERSGSYVNHEDRLQSFEWAVRPPTGSRVEGSVYHALLGEVGLYDASRILAQMAAKVPYFAAATIAAAGAAPHGVLLKSAEVAASS
jgi:NADH-quinone oxidoreductase subunit G